MRRSCLTAYLSVFLALVVCAAPAYAKKKPPDHPIDLNLANEKELEELPGVGPTTAKAIIEFREKSGRIKRVEDLLVIRGISETKLQRMRPYLTVGAPTKPPVAQSAAPKPSTAQTPQKSTPPKQTQ